jgi:cell division protein FtsQ
MDGERRVTEPVMQNPDFRKDCARPWRIAARGLAVAFLGTAILRGILLGGHLEYAGSPWMKMPGQVAGMFGLAAIDIEVTGLQHHDPRDVLSHIGVRPGAPLLGFDPKKARAKLEQLDWVDNATVVRRFPNQLHIRISEREPFVVWQHDGMFEVVDQNGKPMSGIVASSRNVLLQVVGTGANTAASSLVNQMEATPGLIQDVRAAVRVGERRWNLHMKNGVVIELPEHGVDGQLKGIEAIYLASISSKLSVKRMDFRFPGQVVYQALATELLPVADPTTTSSIQ